MDRQLLHVDWINMAFDGITVAAIVDELNKKLIDGRIYKIAQPEKDELLLTIKASGNQYRLVLSANPSLPLVYLTDENKISPMVAPTFTMLLRKHIQNGRIISITQPNFERIIDMEIEHLDEMGDICRKHLMIELMGKYSNIIFIDNNGKILDSIKHVNAMTSSVREVLPGLDYFIPSQEGKLNPMTTTESSFTKKLASVNENTELYKAIYGSFVGISPMIANEICDLSSLASDSHVNELFTDSSSEKLDRLWVSFSSLITKIKNGEFTPVILYENDFPRDYSMVDASSYPNECRKYMDTPSALISIFYKEKENLSRAHQKSADLRKIVSTILERDIKKYDLQLKQLKDTEKNGEISYLRRITPYLWLCCCPWR